MKCICVSFSTAVNTLSAATSLITPYTVLRSPQAAHRELPATPLLICHRGRSPRINTAVPAADGEGEKSQPSSSYLPLLEKPGRDTKLGDPTHRKAAAMGRGRVLGLCHLLSSQTPGFSLLACSDTDCGVPSVLLLPICSGPPPPTITLLACGGFLPSSDLSPLSLSLLPLHTFPSLHHYFPTILPSYLIHIILFQTSPQGIYSHWSSYAGKNNWAHKI